GRLRRSPSPSARSRSVGRLCVHSGVRHLPQLVLQYLAGGGRGQSVKHDQFGWTLVRSEQLGRVRLQVFGAHAGTGKKLIERADLLIAVSLSSDDGRLNDLVVSVQDRLHLGGINVEAGADDQLLGATG